MQDRFEFRTPILDNGVFIMFCYWNAVEGRPTYIELFGDNPRALSLGDDEQCTGLKDKNGNLIYVGDIVRTDLKSPVTYRVGESDRPCITLYDVDVENPDIDAPSQTWCDLWGVEIIGNIHTTKGNNNG